MCVSNQQYTTMNYILDICIEPVFLLGLGNSLAWGRGRGRLLGVCRHGAFQIPSGPMS